jgi:NhaP-type Na+/H+ or K+/H+ antiporter
LGTKKVKVLRGWFPHEPKTLEKSFRFHGYSTATYRWTATALVIGVIAGALLGAVGAFLGFTEGLGTFLWPILIGLTVGLSTGLVAVYETRKYRYKGAT